MPERIRLPGGLGAIIGAVVGSSGGSSLPPLDRRPGESVGEALHRAGLERIPVPDFPSDHPPDYPPPSTDFPDPIAFPPEVRDFSDDEPRTVDDRPFVGPPAPFTPEYPMPVPDLPETLGPPPEPGESPLQQFMLYGGTLEQWCAAHPKDCRRRSRPPIRDKADNYREDKGPWFDKGIWGTQEGPYDLDPGINRDPRAWPPPTRQIQNPRERPDRTRPRRRPLFPQPERPWRPPMLPPKPKPPPPRPRPRLPDPPRRAPRRPRLPDPYKYPQYPQLPDQPNPQPPPLEPVVPPKPDLPEIPPYDPLKFPLPRDPFDFPPPRTPTPRIPQPNIPPPRAPELPPPRPLAQPPVPQLPLPNPPPIPQQSVPAPRSQTVTPRLRLPIVPLLGFGLTVLRGLLERSPRTGYTPFSDPTPGNPLADPLPQPVPDPTPLPTPIVEPLPTPFPNPLAEPLTPFNGAPASWRDPERARRCRCKKCKPRKKGKPRDCLVRGKLVWVSGPKKGKPAGSRCVDFK